MKRDSIGSVLSELAENIEGRKDIDINAMTDIVMSNIHLTPEEQERVNRLYIRNSRITPMLNRRGFFSDGKRFVNIKFVTDEEKAMILLQNANSKIDNVMKHFNVVTSQLKKILAGHQNRMQFNDKNEWIGTIDETIEALESLKQASGE